MRSVTSLYHLYPYLFVISPVTFYLFNLSLSISVITSLARRLCFYRTGWVSSPYSTSLKLIESAGLLYVFLSIFFA